MQHDVAAKADDRARSAARPRVAFLWHELFAWHDSALESYAPHVQPHGSNESAESKRRFANLVAVTPLGEALARLGSLGKLLSAAAPTAPGC